MSRPRIAVLHQGCIPTYRRAFYEGLAKNGERDYVVFHGDPEPGSGLAAAEPPFSFQTEFVRNRYWRILGRSLIYQPVLLRILFGRFDALVIGHEFKFIVNFILLIAFRLMGKPVLFWGFGPTIDPFKSHRSGLGGLFTQFLTFLKSRLILIASGYIAYTASGAIYVEQVGLAKDRISVVWNTIDMSEEIAAHSRAKLLDRAEIRRKIGLSPNSIVLLFVGRLFPPKRPRKLPEAVHAIRAAGHSAIEVVIVGGGPELEDLKLEFGAESWCHILGPIYDRDKIACVFRASDALTIPGLVGLAVNHAFAHGLPVITRESDIHSPEVEYITDGVNGLLLPDDDRLFAEGLVRFADSTEMRSDLAAGALATRSSLDLGRMIVAFDSAVSGALQARSSSKRRVSGA